tara:strand:- start:15176 stop:16582 length:1407 start_codon:yes stop_codon:yes gene_type:complete
MKSVAIVLAGGVGSRLWPLSTESKPKYLLPLNNSQSILGRHLQKISELNFDLIYIVTSHHAFQEVKKEVLELNISNLELIIEPIQKNTAPSIMFASELIERRLGKNINLMIFPSDCFINDYQHIQKLKKLFSEGFFKVPIISMAKLDKNPSQIYGYMLGHELDNSLFRTSKFLEKPNKKQIEKIFLDKNAYVNTGIFITNLKYLNNEMVRLNPKLCEGIKNALDKDSDLLDYKIFSEIESIAIDKALFEKIENHHFFAFDSDWTDIGSFSEYSQLITKTGKDVSDNHIFSKDSFVEDSKNTLVWSQDKFVSIKGLDNILLIENEDNLFISTKDHLGDLEGFQNQAKNKFTISELSDHTNYRPWGWYKTLEETSFYKVKKISVSIGEAISLQSHDHREEVWTILKGSAELFLDDQLSNLREGESVKIQKKSKHYIKNTGNSNLEFIEIQLGSYLGEDDIVRYHDKYDRK